MLISNSELLKKLIYKGAKDKNLDITDVFLDKICFEISILEKQGCIDYYILYSRIIEVCNACKVLRSFGRGSSAGSLINYCLDITKINPLEHGLIFERFLNPDLISFPDIDFDIPKGSKKIILQELKNRYPEYNSFYIAFLSHSNTEFKSVFYNNFEYKVHPSGLVITNKQVDSSIFIHENDRFYISENSKEDELYRDKIDIIELEYLRRLELIVAKIGDEYHPYKLPLDDKKVYKLLASGVNENIFQLNSLALGSILKDFKPDNINDLSLINAVYRPGLINFIPFLIKHKFDGYERFENIQLQKLLEETYGVLVYQETFLSILKQIADFTFAEADIWRQRLVNAAEFDVFKELFNNFSKVFVERIEHLNQSDIDKLMTMIQSNIRMTFTKSHTLSYSIISYWGAYYKTYFNNTFENVFDKDLNFKKIELY